MEQEIIIRDIYTVHELDLGLDQHYRMRPLAGSAVAAGFPLRLMIISRLPSICMST